MSFRLDRPIELPMVTDNLRFFFIFPLSPTRPIEFLWEETDFPVYMHIRVFMHLKSVYDYF